MKLGDWISLLCVIAAGYILWMIKPLLLLCFAAVVVALVLNSLTKRVQALNIPRRFAIPTAIFLFTVMATLFVLVIIPPFVQQFTKLLELLVSFSNRLPGLIAQLQASLPERIRLPEIDEFLAWLTAPDSAVLDVFRNFFTFFNASFQLLLNSSIQILIQTLFVAVLAIMILTNPGAYLNSLLMLFPSFYRDRAREIFGKCEVALGNWLGGIIISSIFIFACSFIGLLLLGVEFAFAHALLAGTLNFIPNIGPTISMVFPVVVALLSEDPWKAVAVIVLYVVLQQIESYAVTPTVMAHQVSLLPAFTLIAQIFFATVFGFLGLLLALPLTVVAKTWIQELLIKDILNHWQVSTRRPFQQSLTESKTNSTVQPEPKILPEPHADTPLAIPGQQPPKQPTEG
ncbi:MAG: AI-2E family transporter [Cyanobacteria bacterium J06650_10]